MSPYKKVQLVICECKPTAYYAFHCTMAVLTLTALAVGVQGITLDPVYLGIFGAIVTVDSDPSPGLIHRESSDTVICPPGFVCV